MPDLLKFNPADSAPTKLSYNIVSLSVSENDIVVNVDPERAKLVFKFPDVLLNIMSGAVFSVTLTDILPEPTLP